MSTFDNILKKSLKHYIKDKSLYEAVIYRLYLPYGNEKVTILKNPTKEEYEKFKANSKYNALRGLTVNNDIYVADASILLHDAIFETLVNSDKIDETDRVDIMWSDDENDRLNIQGKDVLDHYPNVLNLIKDRLDLPKEDKLNHFDLELLYDYYTDGENGLKKAKHDYPNIDLTSYFYNLHGYPKDDFDTWIKKVKKNTLNIQESKLTRTRKALNKAILYETKILRIPNVFADNEVMTIIKNPSPDEYMQFKNNTKYNAIRGIATDKDIYIADATVWLHDAIIQSLEEKGILTDADVDTMFDEDNNGKLEVRGKGNPRVQELINAHKEPRSNKKPSFFTLQAYYDAYQFYDPSIYTKETLAKDYNVPKEYMDIVFYDNKPYEEKDDFYTWLNKTGLGNN